MARRFRRRSSFRRRGRGPSPFAGAIRGGRGLEWYLLVHDCCRNGFAINNFDINACGGAGANGGEACSARTIFPSIVDGGILTLERLVGNLTVWIRVDDFKNDVTLDSFGLKFLRCGLQGGGFWIPEFSHYFMVRTAVAGLLATPQPWQIADGESPTWMLRKVMDPIGDTVIERQDLPTNVEIGSLTAVAKHNIDIRVKRRIDLGHTDLTWQLCIPICDTEALSASDLTNLLGSIQYRLEVRALVRTGPGN